MYVYIYIYICLCIYSCLAPLRCPVLGTFVPLVGSVSCWFPGSRFVSLAAPLQVAGPTWGIHDLHRLHCTKVPGPGTPPRGLEACHMIRRKGKKTGHPGREATLDWMMSRIYCRRLVCETVRKAEKVRTGKHVWEIWAHAFSLKWHCGKQLVRGQNDTIRSYLNNVAQARRGREYKD